MMAVWPRSRIEDAAETVAMGPFGSSIKVSTFVPDGVPIISGQHLKGSRVDDSPGHNFITEEHAERLRKAKVHPGDVILTHAGNIGQVAYIPESAAYDTYVISQRQFFVRCNQDILLPEFLTYYLHSPEGHHALMANAVQTGVPSIAQPVTYVRSIEVPLPPLSVQRAIVDMLGALDDKIDSNRRTSRLLEAFVLAAFSQAFSVDATESGVPVSQLLDVNPRRSLAKGEVATYLGMSDLPTDAAMIETWGSRSFGSGQRFINGDVLMARITPCLENGKTAVVDMLQQDEVGWGSTEFIVLSPKGALSTPWVYCLARSAPVRAYAIRSMTGTSGRQRFNADAFSHYRIANPDATEVEEFNKFAVPSFRKMGQLRDENARLMALRDTLLPGLLTGQLSLEGSAGVSEVLR
ncbi:MAG: hypothetical protein CVT60_04025 [Actinobacteria bacterium HGW-Actinobacteria-10]|jgi:type I restriction enzyme S subunit|nr:MAG: hypothetical protein CVT60_04025 [Actinobacteria bacterium HGW-Actinobacteria-10]